MRLAEVERQRTFFFVGQVVHVFVIVTEFVNKGKRIAVAVVVTFAVVGVVKVQNGVANLRHVVGKCAFDLSYKVVTCLKQIFNGVVEHYIVGTVKIFEVV